MFKKNVGTIDRIVRVIIGLAAIGLFFYLPDAAWRWWLLIGVVPLVTGAVGTCPIYSVLGLSTCPVRGA
ncbi:MAG: YgaP family membrane protein [Devosia sp.]